MHLFPIEPNPILKHTIQISLSIIPPACSLYHMSTSLSTSPLAVKYDPKYLKVDILQWCMLPVIASSVAVILPAFMYIENA